MTQSLNCLLFLTLIYIATCIEEKLIKPGEEFRPFVSIPNYGAIQENIQVLDELDPQSFEGDSFLSFKIKCLSLSQYSIYDKEKKLLIQHQLLLMEKLILFYTIFVMT